MKHERQFSILYVDAMINNEPYVVAFACIVVPRRRRRRSYSFESRDIEHKTK